jgi:hypothetical protein
MCADTRLATLPCTHLWLVVDGQDNLCDACCLERLQQEQQPEPSSVDRRRPPLLRLAEPTKTPHPHLNLMADHGLIAKVNQRLRHRERERPQAGSCRCSSSDADDGGGMVARAAPPRTQLSTERGAGAHPCCSPYPPTRMTAFMAGCCLLLRWRTQLHSWHPSGWQVGSGRGCDGGGAGGEPTGDAGGESCCCGVG